MQSPGERALRAQPPSERAFGVTKSKVYSIMVCDLRLSVTVLIPFAS